MAPRIPSFLFQNPKNNNAPNALFMRTPEFEVYFGREHLGSADRGSFASKGASALVISLAGRSWKLREIDWSGWKAFVEPAKDGGKSRWLPVPESPMIITVLSVGATSSIRENL